MCVCSSESYAGQRAECRIKIVIDKQKANEPSDKLRYVRLTVLHVPASSFNSFRQPVHVRHDAHHASPSSVGQPAGQSAVKICLGTFYEPQGDPLMKPSQTPLYRDALSVNLNIGNCILMNPKPILLFLYYIYPRLTIALLQVTLSQTDCQSRKSRYLTPPVTFLPPASRTHL